MVNTTSFLNLIKAGAKDEIISQASHVAVGTDETTPTVGDTSLGAEVTRKARQEYTEGTSNVVISLWLNSLESNGNDLKETGCFTAISGGTLLTRETFTSISKTSSVELWIDIEEQVDVSQ